MSITYGNIWLILYLFAVSEFSEALEELGTCLLEKAALNDDEDSSEHIQHYFKLSMNNTSSITTNLRRQTLHRNTNGSA